MHGREREAQYFADATVAPAKYWETTENRSRLTIEIFRTGYNMGMCDNG